MIRLGRFFSSVKKRVRRPLPPPLMITENAADRIKYLIGSKDEVDGVCLGVKTRGCNGMSYTMNYVERGKVDKMLARRASRRIRVSGRVPASYFCR